MVEMTRQKLRQYKSLKKEMEKLDNDINKLYDKRLDIPTVKGKVTGSCKEFPYIQTHMTMEMQEPKATDLLSRRIRIKEQRKKEAEQQALEIEQFISGIQDSTDRQIFEMLFLDRKKQREVAGELGYSRSRIAQKIGEYLKD